MNKDETHKLFISILEGVQTIYKYFEVKNFATYDYELQLMDENWAVTGTTGFPIHLHHLIPENQDKGAYRSQIHGIFRKEYFTLIFCPSDTGGSGFAYIFDNDKEINLPREE